jgi:hypothetical protein
MKEVRLEVLIEALQDTMFDTEDDDTFDQMEDVKHALEDWNGEGRVPYREQLVGWGLTDALAAPPVEEDAGSADRPTEEPEASDVHLSESEYASLRRALRRLRTTASESQGAEAREVQQAVTEWYDAGMEGDLPGRVRLEGWGLWPPSASESEIESPASAPDAPDDESARDVDSPLNVTAGPEDAGEPASATAADVEDAEAPESSTASQSSEPVTVDDLPATLRERYLDAQALLEQEEYYQARGILEKLAPVVSGPLGQEISFQLQDARVELDRITTRLENEAAAAEARFPQNLEVQQDVWQAVLNVNPDAREAIQALARLRQRREEREIEDELALREEQLDDVARIKDLPAINRFLGEVDAWLNQARDKSLSDALQRRLTGLRDQLLSLRNRVRDDLGFASTLAVEGEFRESYKLARGYFEQGTKVMVDAAGIFGPPDAEVETPEFFRQISTKYLAQLRQKVDERMEEARAAKRPTPDAARQQLQDAYGWLTDDVLTMDHRSQLQPLLEQVEREIEDVERRQRRFAEARERVEEAQGAELPAQERIRLLTEVQQIYPDYPQLDSYLDEARDYRAAEVATEVSASLVRAQKQLGDQQFDEALATIQEARERASRAVPSPKPGSSLAGELQRLQERELEILDAQQRYQDALEIASQIESALARYDDGDGIALDEARQLLGRLDDRQRQYSEVQAVAEDLTKRQDDDQNWSDGREAYNRRDWEAAIRALSNIKPSDPRRQEAVDLAERARAAHETIAAEAHEDDHQWRQALECYQVAVGLFEQHKVDSQTEYLAERARSGLAHVRKIEARDQEVDRELDDCQTRLKGAVEAYGERRTPDHKVESVPQFARVVERLEALKQGDTMRVREIERTLGQARTAWRTAYLDAIEAALESKDRHSLEQASLRAEELREAGLLYKDENHDAAALARRLQFEYLEAQYRTLIQHLEPDWAKIERNRRKILSIPGTRQDHPEYEEQLLSAVRRRIDAKLRGLSDADAKVKLAKELEHYFIRTEPEVVKRYVKLCWKTEDWKKAEEAAAYFGLNGDAGSRELVRVWHGLNRAARLYAEDNVARGQSWISQLRGQIKELVSENTKKEIGDDGSENTKKEIGDDGSENTKKKIGDDVSGILKEMEDWLEEWTVERLIQEAQQAEALGTDAGYIRAAEKYALANYVAPTHDVVAEGLQQLGSKLAPGIRTRCSQARNFKIGQRTLDEAYAELEKQLYQTLANINSVAHLLELGGTLSTTLQEDLTRLGAKVDTWGTVKNELDKYQAALDAARQSPRPLGDDGYGGGWDFEQPRVFLDTAREAAGRDAELQALIMRKEEYLATCETQARTFTDSVRTFVAAVREENFDAVIEQARELERTWRDLQRDGWQGLNLLIRHSYPMRDVSDLRGHREVATQQRRNYELWQRWSRATLTAYEAFGGTIRDLNRPLEELKNFHSLRHILDLCDASLQASDRFLSRLAERPDVDPISQKAKEEAECISREEIEQVRGGDGWRARIAQLRSEAEEAWKAFRKNEWQQLVSAETAIKRLQTQRGFLGLQREKPIPAVRLQVLEQCIDACEQVDPSNEELERFRNWLEELRRGGNSL